MASIVPCVHSRCGTYPVSTPLASTDDVIQLSLVRHEFHRVKFHPYDDNNDIQEIATSYQVRKPSKSHLFNPFCERCEKALIKHLTVDHPLPYCSAYKVLKTVRELLYKHIELEDTKAIYPNTRRFEKLSYSINYCFDKLLLSDETGGFTPALWKVSKTFVQVDDGSEVFFLRN